MGAQFGAGAEETLKYPKWQKAYQDAVTELNRAKLPQRVLEAESAIFRRLQDLAESQDHRLEREAIQNALGFLRILKQEKLDFPDWKKK